MGSLAISCAGLSKKYRLGEAARYKSLRDTIAGAMRAIGRRDSRGPEEPPHVWALRDVSFDVPRGQTVGIVGRNGAGKSTLLRILSRITEPTGGRAEVRGRVGSLLEVGTGFHPELSGRDNVFLNGAILGMTRAEIARKFDEIVAFAEVERFLDTPVKHYSSGMYLRLAFAVAAHLEPEILLVDEILAVGDAAFQKKCLGRIGDVARQGRTVLFVSHNMAAVRALCSRACLLRDGGLALSGSSAEVVTAYLSQSDADGAAGRLLFAPDRRPASREVALVGIQTVGAAGAPQRTFEPHDPIRVEILFEVRENLRGARWNLHVMTQDGDHAFTGADHGSRPDTLRPGLYRSACTIPGGLLNRRPYVLELSCDIPGVDVLIPRREYLRFDVEGAGNEASTFPEPWPGVVCPRLSWEVTAAASVDEFQRAPISVV